MGNSMPGVYSIVKFSSSFPLRHRCHRSSDPNVLKWLTAVFRLIDITVKSMLVFLSNQYPLAPFPL